MICPYFRKDCALLFFVLFYKEISSVSLVLFVFHVVSDASMFPHCLEDVGSGFLFHDYRHKFCPQVAREAQSVWQLAADATARFYSWLGKRFFSSAQHPD
jgi:hypothetical protein